MARTTSVVPPKSPFVVPRRPRNRFERELLFQRIAIGVVALIVLAIVAIPAVGYYREIILREQEEIARVNSVGFRMDEYIKQLRYRQKQIDAQVQLLEQFGGGSGASQQVQQQRSILPTQLVFDWVDEEIIRQNAGKLGVTVTADEVDARLRKDFEPLPNTPTQDTTAADPDATPTPTPPPTPVPAPFEERYKNALQFSGLTDADYRSQVRTRLLREKLDEKLKSQVETVQEQIRVRAIFTSSEEEAKKALDRIRAGESFDAVAAEVSSDSVSKEQGGDLGWLPKGVKTKEFDDAIFALKDKSVSGPVNISGTWYLFQLVDGPTVRALDGENLDTLKNAALSTWLADQKKDGVNTVEYKITSDRQLWAQDRLDREKKAEQRRLAQQQQSR